MDGLIEAGYATFVVDLWGYGETLRDETGWLTPDPAPRDLKAVLERVWWRTGQGQRPILFGWSLSSMVSRLISCGWELVAAACQHGWRPAVLRQQPSMLGPGG
jgi:pimeloyl-ACP methyl ester carboxylesterase